MTKYRALVMAGVGCLVVGAALLALAGEVGTLFGTTLGITGVALLGWGWAQRH